MFKLKFFAILCVASLALHAQTDHDAPVKGGESSFWLSLDQSITQSPAPADATEILQHTHHDVSGGHKIRVFHAGDLSGGTPQDFNLGDQVWIFLAGDPTASPSVIIRAEKGATANFPKHAGQLAALCAGEAAGASSRCELNWRTLLALKDVLELTPGEAAALGPNQALPASVLSKVQATRDRLTHVWRFSARNGGQFVQTQSRESGRLGYHFRSSSGSLDLRPVQMVLVKANSQERLIVADRLNKRKCWMFEIGYPDMKAKTELSPTRDELQKLKAGCKGCWIGSCKLCPADVYKPGKEASKPGGLEGHGGH